MVAVYCYKPFTLYVLDIAEATEESFYEALKEHEEYPHPTSDVVILDGDRVVLRFHSKLKSQ